MYRNLREAKVEDPELVKQIKQYAELSDSIDKAKSELKKLESKYKELEDVIRPLLEELEETQDRALEVEDILVTIKKRGFERTSIAYKEALEWVRDRINPAMKKIVDDSLEATKKTSYIASQIGVQKLKEEKVDMEELERMLKKLKKENPDKKVTYSFIKGKQYPKGYVIRINGKILEGELVNESHFQVGDKLKMYFDKLGKVFSFRNNKLSQDIDALKTKVQSI